MIPNLKRVVKRATINHTRQTKTPNSHVGSKPFHLGLTWARCLWDVSERRFTCRAVPFEDGTTGPWVLGLAAAAAAPVAWCCVTSP